MPRVRNRLPLFALILWLLPVPASALRISGAADRQAIRVGDTITITITGERGIDDPSFLGANVTLNGLWQRGGQTVQSPDITDGRMTKVWHFQLVAAAPGSTSVTPVVYLGPEAALGVRVDSILASPVSVVIEEAPPERRWPWLIPVIGIILVALSLVWRFRRRQSADRYVRPDLPPLAEALEMLESISPNRREDRATAYLNNLGHLLMGYLTRRLHQPLTGRTPHEVCALAEPHLPDPAVRDALASLLDTWSTARFGTSRVDFDALVKLEAEARRVLEQVEATWV